MFRGCESPDAFLHFWYPNLILTLIHNFWNFVEDTIVPALLLVKQEVATVYDCNKAWVLQPFLAFDTKVSSEKYYSYLVQ